MIAGPIKKNIAIFSSTGTIFTIVFGRIIPYTYANLLREQDLVG